MQERVLSKSRSEKEIEIIVAALKAHILRSQRLTQPQCFPAFLLTDKRADTQKKKKKKKKR